jgi:inosine-uridine nucleoside N-ribohydrolase
VLFRSVTHKALVRADGFRGVGRVGRFVAELLDYFARFHRRTYGFDGSPIHDALALAHVFRPGLLETVERHVAIETESELCRGRTVVDLWRRTGEPPNAHVAVGVDAAAFVELLTERIASLG